MVRTDSLLTKRPPEHRYGGDRPEWWGRCLVIKHENCRRPVGGDFRNVPTVEEIATQAQLASGRKGESGFAIRRPYNTSPAALRIRVVVVKSLRSQQPEFHVLPFLLTMRSIFSVAVFKNAAAKAALGFEQQPVPPGSMRRVVANRRRSSQTR